MRVSFSPFLPWLLHQPVDGEGEEVVEEDEDAEAEQEEVDDHLDAPPSAASLPPASLLAGAALPSWKVSPRLAPSGCTGDVYSNILYLSTHTLLQTQYLSIFVGKQIYSKYILYIQTLKHYEYLCTYIYRKEYILKYSNIYSIYSKLSTYSNKLVLCLCYRFTLLLNLKFEAISFDKCQVGCSAVVQRHDVYFIYSADQSLGTSFFCCRLDTRHIFDFVAG